MYTDVLVNAAILDMRTGRADEARAYLLEALEIDCTLYAEDHEIISTAYFNLACNEALAGNKAEAFRLLREAVDRKYPFDDLGTDDDLASLRGDPEFHAILEAHQQVLRDFEANKSED